VISTSAAVVSLRKNRSRKEGIFVNNFIFLELIGPCTHFFTLNYLISA